jgi:hypothetical protein
MGISATIYTLGEFIHVDCDICHEALLEPGTVAVGSNWIALAVSKHAGECKGTPLQSVEKDSSLPRSMMHFTEEGWE